jgi:hypothetical protein
MTTDHRRVDVHMAQEVLLDDAGFLREIVERVLQEVLEAEHRAWPLVTSFSAYLFSTTTSRVDFV